MKKWLPALLALSIGIAPATTLAAGSLATRLHAAQAARDQQQAASQQATDTPQAVAQPRPAAPVRSEALVRSEPKQLPKVQPPASPEPTTKTPRRINVAEWLNQTPVETSQQQPSAPRSLQLNDQSPRIASSRRNPHLEPARAQALTEDPLPIPPAQTGPPVISAPATSAPVTGTVSDDDPVAITPAELLPADGSELRLTQPGTLSTEEVAESGPVTTNLLKSAEQPRPVSNGSVANGSAATQKPTSELIEEPATIDESTTLQKDTLQTETALKADTSQPTETVKTQPKPLEVAPITPAKPKKVFSRSMLQLRDRIRYVLSYHYQRPENVAARSPWGVMHYLIAYGVDAELQSGRERVNAIGWMCFNQPCRKMQLMTFDGQHPVPRNGPGYQGHEGQFLHMLALSRVKSTYPMRVEGHDLTVQDLIEYEKLTCRAKSELTFKLVALSHYLPSDATWESKWGESWSIPRLIEEELAQPIHGACCGGTHRLIGYSMAVKVREKRDEPITGQWARAQKYVDAYHRHVIKLQNRDGSFSTNWLKSRDADGDLDRRIQTTGHVLEWLVFSLPEDELTDPRIVRAVSFLSSSMISNRQKEWEIGPRGHALRALALYGERVFEDKPGERRALLAGRPRK